MQKNNKKLYLALRPSRIFFTVISGVHLLALIIASISELSWIYLGLMFLTLAISYYFLIRKYIYRTSRYSVIKLWQDENVADPMVWQLQLANHKTISTRLQPKGYLSSFIIIMEFKYIKETGRLSNYKFYNLLNKLLNKLDFKKIPVIILPDMLDHSDFHQLTLYLTGY